MNERLHDYREPLTKDCRAGMCSLNSCMYPSCSPGYVTTRGVMENRIAGRTASVLVMDDPVRGTTS